MRLHKDDASIYTRVAIFGLPGSGKSTLVSKLAATHRLTWICLDNDKDVLLKLSDAELENVNFIDLPDSASFPVAAPTLLSLFKTGKGRVCNTHGMFTCALCTKNKAGFSEIDFSKHTSRDIVVIDTGSQLGRSILAHVTKDDPVDYKPERDDWGSLRKFTEFFASQFQGFRGNLIVIFHAIEMEVKSGDKVIGVKYIPDFGSRGMALTIGKNFSHVIYMEVKNKKHRAYSSTTANNDCLTKSRTDFAIESLPEPSLVPLFPIKESAPMEESSSSSTTPTEVPSNQSTQASTQISNSPAQNAVSGLNDLKARLAAQTAKKG
jgi:hypothetical protein